MENQWSSRPGREPSGDPSSPNCFLENAANHLAYRKIHKAMGLVFCGWLWAISIFVLLLPPLAKDDAARFVGAGIACLISLIMLVTDRIAQRHWNKRPIVQRFSGPRWFLLGSRRGMAVVIACIAGPFALIWLSNPAEYGHYGLASLCVAVFFVTLGLPPQVIYPRARQILQHRLDTDPLAREQLAEIQRTYPPGAPYPFE